MDRNFNLKYEKKWFPFIKKLLEGLQERSRARANDGNVIKIDLVMSDGFNRGEGETQWPETEIKKFIEIIGRNRGRVMDGLDFSVCFFFHTRLCTLDIFSQNFTVLVLTRELINH